MEGQDKELSQAERAVALRHLEGAEAALRRQFRLSVQYGVVVTLFLIAAFIWDSVLLTVPIWAGFLIWLLLRYRSLCDKSAELRGLFAALKARGLLDAPPKDWGAPAALA